MAAASRNNRKAGDNPARKREGARKPKILGPEQLVGEGRKTERGRITYEREGSSSKAPFCALRVLCGGSLQAQVHHRAERLGMSKHYARPSAEERGVIMAMQAQGASGRQIAVESVIKHHCARAAPQWACTAHREARASTIL